MFVDNGRTEEDHGMVRRKGKTKAVPNITNHLINNYG